jgi:hypothetical protein
MANAPRWLVPVAVVALLWNLLGCFALYVDLAMTPEAIAKLTPAEQQLHAARPAWAVAATAVAVIGLALALRRKWALPLLVASLAGVLVQDFGMFVLADGAALAGPVAVALQGVVLLVAIGLAWLAWRGAQRGWLR